MFIIGWNHGRLCKSIPWLMTWKWHVIPGYTYSHEGLLSVTDLWLHEVMLLCMCVCVLVNGMCVFFVCVCVCVCSIQVTSSSCFRVFLLLSSAIVCPLDYIVWMDSFSSRCSLPLCGGGGLFDRPHTWKQDIPGPLLRLGISNEEDKWQSRGN